MNNTIGTRLQRLTLTLSSGLLLLLLLASCASLPSSADLDALTARTIQSAFRDQGIAKVDRLNQDLAQAACSQEKAPDDATMQKGLSSEISATYATPHRGTRPAKAEMFNPTSNKETTS